MVFGCGNSCYWCLLEWYCCEWTKVCFSWWFCFFSHTNSVLNCNSKCDALFSLCELEKKVKKIKFHLQMVVQRMMWRSLLWWLSYLWYSSVCSCCWFTISIHMLFTSLLECLPLLLHQECMNVSMPWHWSCHFVSKHAIQSFTAGRSCDLLKWMDT
jgi:hypothetical protein